MAILSCLILQIVNLNTLVIGKFIHGYCVTVVHICAIKMINETVPVYLLGLYGTVIQTATAFGYILVLGLGTFLPSEDYNPELVGDKINDAAK